MPAQVGDVYQMVVKQYYLDTEYNNVFWYRVQSLTSATNVADEMCNSVYPQIRPYWAAITSQDCYTYEVTSVNWRDPSDFFTLTIGGTTDNGDMIFQPANSRLRLFYRYNKPQPGVTPGRKLIGGLDEGIMLGDDVATDWIDDVTAFAVTLGTQISTPNAVMRPVVVQRQVNGVDIMPALGTGIPQHWLVPNASFVKIGTVRQD